MRKAFGLAIAAVGMVSTSARCDEFGTLDEALSMLNRAIPVVRSDKGHAIAMFNHNDRQFRDRDLFIFCFNTSDGKFTAHEALVSVDVRTLHDQKGTAYGEAMFSNAREGKITPVAYVAPFPGTSRQVPKRAYVTRIADQVCGVSAYLYNGPAQLTE